MARAGCVLGRAVIHGAGGVQGVNVGDLRRLQSSLSRWRLTLGMQPVTEQALFYVSLLRMGTASQS